MKIEYEETTGDLQTRIDIHQQFGKRDIDEWMLELLQPKPGIRILDVGCGSGKQLEAFQRHLEGEVELTGADVSPELLVEARERRREAGADWKIVELDFNRRFPLEDTAYDLVSCCFAIYYAENVSHTIGEMHRVLKPGGRLFTTGPMPENKQLFYELIREATGQPIPSMPGSSRYGSEILGEIRRRFTEVELGIFENPLSFEQVDPFLAYTRASLSEDRKLWKSLFQGPEGFERVMEQIERAALQRFEREGQLVMTKVVGGIVATK